MAQIGIYDPEKHMFAVDMSQRNEYAELEILQYRTNIEMAMDPETVKEKVVGYDEHANKAIMQDVENPRIGMIDKLGKSKRNLLEDLLATRKARASSKTGQKDEGAGQMAALIRAAKEWENEQANKAAKVVTAEVIPDETKEQPTDSSGSPETDKTETPPSPNSG